MEIGRTVIQVCRLLRTTDVFILKNLNSKIQLDQALVGAVALVAMQGDGDGAKLEGWFGLAVLANSTWARGLVVEYFVADEDMRSEARKVMAKGGGPDWQNATIVSQNIGVNTMLGDRV